MTPPALFPIGLLFLTENSEKHGLSYHVFVFLIFWSLMKEALLCPHVLLVT